MGKILINGGTIVNEGRRFIGYILIANGKIASIGEGKYNLPSDGLEVIDAMGKIVMPGVIDDQVHFREPGLTYKADIHSESIAAVAGGVTSFMEMPNTKPPTTNISLLEDKFSIAAETSVANYSFYLGATNDNIEQIRRIDPKHVCGVKVFMGSSTGNMLVDDNKSLAAIFAESPILVATHCEDEATIKANMERYKQMYGDNTTIQMHSQIRSEEACYKCSARAVDLATRYNARLHILHLSTARELTLFSDAPLSQKRITNEVCVHHLWFTDTDYAVKGNMIKWNPAIKSLADREALREGIRSGKVDVVATDHAPHTLEEKRQPYPSAPSGGPLVQHSLVAMLEMCSQGVFTFEQVVDKMCHAPAQLYEVQGRGYLREGYWADIAIVNPAKEWVVTPDNILYKCGWSPFEGERFSHSVTHTIINGQVVMQDGVIDRNHRGMALVFDR